jgi:hypothetical protein
MDPDDAVKALSGIVCTQGRLTCLNAVAEALDELLDTFKGHDCARPYPFLSRRWGRSPPRCNRQGMPPLLGGTPATPPNPHCRTKAALKNLRAAFPARTRPRDGHLRGHFRSSSGIRPKFHDNTACPLARTPPQAGRPPHTPLPDRRCNRRKGRQNPKSKSADPQAQPRTSNEPSSLS